MKIPGSTLEVFPICMGTSDLGTRIKGDDVNRLLDAYAEAGGNFLDTAHVYAAWIPGGSGASETAICQWLKESGRRRETVIATKGGHPPMGESYPHASDFLRPEAVAQDVEESLNRLEIDQIDLYYLHRDDGTTPVNEIIDSLNKLPAVRYFGASNWSVRRLSQANEYAKQTQQRGFVTLQNQWSLATPSWKIESDPTVRFVRSRDVEWCLANDVVIHAYSSTANGYFAKVTDEGPFSGNSARRDRVRQWADQNSVTPNQVVLSWLLNGPCPVIPIVGTTKLPHLLDALGSIELVMDDLTRKWLLGSDLNE